MFFFELKTLVRCMAKQRTEFLAKRRGRGIRDRGVDNVSH